MKLFSICILILITGVINAQNPVYIPPAVSGTTFNLDIQNGTKQFYPGITTNTMGVNGNFMGPTLILNKWDMVTMNVTNSLTGPNGSTSMNWYGLHVPADVIGGPYQVINQGSTWSPSFQVLNWAATYWYRPLGLGKSQEQVSKGVSGFIIVKDSAESNLTLPRTYGADDFPLMIQSRSFDATGQIEVQSAMDTSISVNGTVNPVLDVPAQVVRLRLLNASSRRSYIIGFDSNLPFHLITVDAGLLDSSIALTRMKLDPGDRAEILVDLQGMNGQSFFMKSFASEYGTPHTTYGALSLAGVTIPGYSQNPLNGADYNIMQLNVIPQIAGAVTTMPVALVPNNIWPVPGSLSNIISFETDTPSSSLCQGLGPHSIDVGAFNPNYIHVTTYKNKIEKWRINNQAGISHPLHFHGYSLYMTGISATPIIPAHLRGRQDNVLIHRGEIIEFVIKFEDFGHNSIPFLIQSNLLRAEDQGAMQTVKVLDTTTAIPEYVEKNNIWAYPNPARNWIKIESVYNRIREIMVMDLPGKIIFRKEFESYAEEIDVSAFKSGLYLVSVLTDSGTTVLKVLRE